LVGVQLVEVRVGEQRAFDGRHEAGVVARRQARGEVGHGGVERLGAQVDPAFADEPLKQVVCEAL
jgi:hypothetical protein